MELDREKLIKTVGDAIGVDLFGIRAFKLEFEKKPNGGLSVKVNLWDENQNRAKQAADGLVERYSLPVAPPPTVPTPPKPAFGPLPAPPTAPVAGPVAPTAPAPVQSP